MPTTTLYLVRHGETDCNRQRIVQGRGVDAPLNATGRRQAEALARRFAQVALDALYSSPLQRAVATAEAIRCYHPQIPFYVMADLEEMGWGSLEGKPYALPYAEQIDYAYARWRAGDYGYRIPGGESILEVQQRALRALEQILEAQAGRTVLVVTHGRWLRILLASILPAYGLARMEQLSHANTAVNQIVYDGHSFRAVQLCCTAHLEEAAVDDSLWTEVAA